jgi:hypothetical protein
MGLAQAGITAANPGSKAIPESKFAQLPVDAITVAAGDQAKGVTAR